MHQTASTVYRNVLLNNINNNSFQSMCLKCPPPACTCDLRQSHHGSITASIWPVQNLTKFASSERLMTSLMLMQQQIDCTIHKYNAHHHHHHIYFSSKQLWPIVRKHLGEPKTNLIPFSLVMSCCHSTSLVFRISQNSVATLVGSGGWSSYQYMCRSLIRLTMKTARKYVDFWRSYIRRYIAVFFIFAPCTSSRPTPR